MRDSLEKVAFFMQDVTEGWEKSEQLDKEMFDKAYNLATEVHKEQFREEGMPYITHIDGILDIMKNELNDFNYRKWTVIALHDVLEDSNKYTYEDLKTMFDNLIVDNVRVLTKVKGVSIEQYLSNIEGYEFAPTLIKIKLTDRLHNVRSLKNILNINKEKVRTYIAETKKYYLPLAQKNNKTLYTKLCEALESIDSILNEQ
jgi:GTP pyrophosphokinase